MKNIFLVSRFFVKNESLERKPVTPGYLKYIIPTLGYSQADMWISLSICLSVSLCLWSVVCVAFFIIHAARNCVQRMRPQATGSNPLSGSIICLSVHPVVHGPFVIFVFVFNSFITRDYYYYYYYYQCGFPESQLIYPYTGVQRTLIGSSRAYMSVSLFLFLSSRPHHFLVIICAANNCAQHMLPQATGSNPLRGSIICLSIRLSIPLQAFCDFCIYINFQCGGPVLQCIYPHIGVWRTPVGSSWAYISVCVSQSICPSLRLSLCLTLWSSASPFGNQSAWSVIARSACGRRPRVQIPWVAV